MNKYIISIAVSILVNFGCASNVKTSVLPLSSASIGLIGLNSFGQLARVSVPKYEVMVGDLTNPPNTQAPGSIGGILTSNGATTNPTFQPPLSGTSVNEVECLTFDITAASGTAQATGCTITLPFAGRWRIHVEIRALISAVANLSAILSAKLRDDSLGSFINLTERSGPSVPVLASGIVYGEIVIEKVYDISSSTIIEVYGTRINGGGTGFSLSRFQSDINGRFIIQSQQLLQQ